jgi:hypothetical protein
MNPRLNIFTCCNGFYKSFIPLFVSSALHHNPDAVCEVGVDDACFHCRNQRLVNALLKLYGDNFRIRNGVFSSPMDCINPSAVRFLTTPSTQTDFVYIADVDMIFLEGGIADIHLAHMKRTGLPCSNVVRPKLHDYLGQYRRLSGLHFSPWFNLYPLPPLDSIPSDLLKNEKGADEALLYWLVQNKGCYLPKGDMFRPIHGIHFSPNKVYLPHPERWEHVPWIPKLKAFLASDDFKCIEPLIEGVCASQLEALRRLI